MCIDEIFKYKRIHSLVIHFLAARASISVRPNLSSSSIERKTDRAGAHRVAKRADADSAVVIHRIIKRRVRAYERLIANGGGHSSDIIAVPAT